MHAKTLLVCGLLAVTAAGCGDDSNNDATTTAATTVAATTVPKAGYVGQVNHLCDELIPKVLDATGGGHPATFPLKDYIAERPKLKALYKSFDAKVDALTVAAADQSAADAFDAFRHESDAADAHMAAAAATGKQDKFDAAFDVNQRGYDTSSVVKDLAAAGIRCPGR